MLSPYEDRLSEVPRWTIVRTIQKQSVMDHSARVAIVAPRIATRYYNVEDADILLNVCRAALLHDQDEAISGDISSPAKRMMDLGSFQVNASHFAIEHPFTVEMTKEQYDAVVGSVKAADYYEALVFLAKEQSMGNNSITDIWNDVIRNFRSKFPDKPDMVEDLILHAADYRIMKQDPLR